uniref:Uncharacterized protein n=1 Tax=Tanacetum cinerariifolium TaxID=118510 RepID=A0A699H0H5_TANCI|nr:hypothetical protein [Tanacetum cinerariifolium]
MLKAVHYEVSTLTVERLPLLSLPIRISHFSKIYVNVLSINNMAEKLHFREPEFTLGEFGVQFLILKQFQDMPKVFLVLLISA